ncbi:MAG: NAD(P)H-dependent oxidoreductase subunit E [Chloroflexi bacterium]|nr:NAD(P)H-dependent oxidoreductase subunit E [Chloroflexota bacterium]
MTASEDLEQRIQSFPRQRTYLLPALHEVQEAYGWLPPDALEALGLHLRVPKSEVFGIASSFPDFLLSAPTRTERTCTGASCRVLGGPSHAEATADCLFVCGVGPASEVDGRLVGRGGLKSEVPTVTSGTLVQDGSCSRAVADTARAGGTHVGCAGNCWQAPALSHDGGSTWTSQNTAWTPPGERWLLHDVGRIDPYAPKLYAAFEKALSMGTDRVWELVRESGLRGRGGAYFPVGAKWETARNTAADKKFLLVNAEEGEPGIYKDRHLLEGDPHRVVEGILIAAFGIGATNVIIFVNGEARLSHERLLAAIEAARRAGNIYLPLEVRQGAGGYVLGEETALINAIHGLRAEPLARPPFPAVSGLQSSPTVINNVESLTNLPDIILNGADWFRSVGTQSTPGTKLVSLAGGVRQPGLHEVPLGTSLGTILDAYGGGATADLSAVLVGGPSGSILPTSLLETPFDVQALQSVGGILGAGGIVALTTQQCPVAAVRELVAYNSRESCGKCTPCREGTVRMLNLFEDIQHGRSSNETFSTLEDLNDILAFGSLCGLGQMAPNPVRALMRHFGPEVEAHKNGRCPAGVCA